MVWFQVTAKLVQPKGMLCSASAASLVCSLVIVQSGSVHLDNPRRLILWKKLTCFYHSEPVELKHLAPIGYGRDGRVTAVANHLFSRNPLF